MIRTTLALLLGLSLMPFAAQAIGVDFVLSNVGDGRYRYDYTIRNDGSLGAATELALVDLLFDPAQYDESSLTNVSSPLTATDWNQQFLASAPGGVPAAFDLFAVGSGIAVGSYASGFAVEFRWLGNGRPGSQPFEVYDPQTFGLLQQGMTTPVPEPETWLMFFVGTPLLAVLGRRRGRRSNGLGAAAN
jgi:hypothetical protein